MLVGPKKEDKENNRLCGRIGSPRGHQSCPRLFAVDFLLCYRGHTCSSQCLSDIYLGNIKTHNVYCKQLTRVSNSYGRGYMGYVGN